MTPWKPTQPNTLALWNEYKSDMTRRLRVWRLCDALEMGQNSLKMQRDELSTKLRLEKEYAASLARDISP